VRDEQSAREPVREALPASTRDNTTMMFGSQGSVRVKWEDGHGPHEKVLYRDFRIGRDDGCEIHLDDPMISRRHAEVSYDEGLWWIRDLGSRNGTQLDGHRVTRAPLPARCEIKLYDAAPILRCEVHAASNAQTVTSSKWSRDRS